MLVDVFVCTRYAWVTLKMQLEFILFIPHSASVCQHPGGDSVLWTNFQVSVDEGKSVLFKGCVLSHGPGEPRFTELSTNQAPAAA